jgi:hypothetical protein
MAHRGGFAELVGGNVFTDPAPAHTRALLPRFARLLFPAEQ